MCSWYKTYELGPLIQKCIGHERKFRDTLQQDNLKRSRDAIAEVGVCGEKTGVGQDIREGQDIWKTLMWNTSFFFCSWVLITATGLCELANYILNNCHKTILLSQKTKCQRTKADNVERQMFKIPRFLCQHLFCAVCDRESQQLLHQKSTFMHFHMSKGLHNSPHYFFFKDRLVLNIC